MKARTSWTRVWLVLAVGAVWLSLALSASAQVKTQTTATSGQGSQQVQVERGEVVYVSGNSFVVKMEDGSLRHFDNVPESARATVDGKEIGVRDLQPGMKLERTITTTTVPRTITTVQTVTGTVWNVTPPTSVILTLEDGKNQQFKIPKGQKFTVNGQETDAWGLRKGMKISATKVVTVPEEVISEQRNVTGSAPPPPPAPVADAPILIAELAEEPIPDEAPASLPKTGSPLPLIGLLGILSLAAGWGLKAVRSHFRS
jgi:RNase P/RNase MRP subunit p29